MPQTYRVTRGPNGSGAAPSGRPYRTMGSNRCSPSAASTSPPDLVPARLVEGWYNRPAGRPAAAVTGGSLDAGTLRFVSRSGGNRSTGGSPPAPPSAFALVGVRVLDGSGGGAV